MEKENLVNQVGDIFNQSKAVCRPFPEAREFALALQKNYIAWSWGLRTFRILVDSMDKKEPMPMALRFRVSGRKHKGYVYMVVNGLDYFNVYYTTLQDKIKYIDTDIDLENIIDVIDNRVETD